jgi:hypothetical protein
MQTLDNNIGSMSGELEFRTRELLTTAGKWGRFLAILGFIGCALMLLGGIIFLSIIPQLNGEVLRDETPLIVIIYILGAALYFFPTLYLYRFSLAAIETGKTGSPEDLFNAALNIKKLFKFVGILTLIIICLYIVLIVGGILLATLMR